MTPADIASINRKLLSYQELSVEINLPEPTIRYLKDKRKIPYIRLGHRSVKFSADAVMKALSKLEVKAVAAA